MANLPAPGTVWTPKPKFAHLPDVAVEVLFAGRSGVVTTDVRGRPGRSWHALATFRETYRRAPAGTPPPTVWPLEAEPEDGALIVRLGDVPVGWLFRDGWEEPGFWNVRLDDDRSYEGSLVECRPPDERDVILEAPLPVRPKKRPST